MRRAAVTAVAVCGLAAPAPALAAFPGSNGQIAFERQLPGGGTPVDIFAMGPQGESPLPLAANPDNDLNPSYSGDGERIVFERSAGDTIWAMNADGTGQAQVTQTSPVSDDSNPAFSPDGTRIVFERGDASDSEIWVMNADGSGQTQLTDNAFDDVDPAFSPDGTKIAFSRTGGSLGRIFVMDADGQNQTELTFVPGNVDTEPDWSPDGSTIAFTRNDTGGTIDIYAMTADGQNEAPLIAGPPIDSAPAYSPDGTRIVFSRSAIPSAQIYSADASGGSVTPLTEPVATQVDDAPTWQPLNPPACAVTGEAKQKSAKQVVVVVQCDEDALVGASGLLTAPKPKKRAAASKKRPVPLAPVSLELGANTPAALALTPATTKGLKLLKKALKAGKKPKGSIEVTTTDDLGLTDTDSFAVKLKKARKK